MSIIIILVSYRGSVFPVLSVKWGPTSKEFKTIYSRYAVLSLLTVHLSIPTQNSELTKEPLVENSKNKNLQF